MTGAKSFVHVSSYVLLLASAYVVYGLFCEELPVQLALLGIGAFGSLALIIKKESLTELWAALRKADGSVLLFMTLHGACTALWLFLVLWSIHKTSPLNALFVLLMQPLLQTWVGIQIGDQVGKKGMFLFGVVVAAIGAILVKLPLVLEPDGGDVALHTEDLFLFTAVGVAVLAHYFRTELTRCRGVTPAVAVLSGQLIVVVVGALSALWLVDDWAAEMSWTRGAGLAYLGVVPTAIAGVGMQRCFNLYGWPQVTALEMFKPLWGLFLAFGFARLGFPGPTEIPWLQWLGLVLTLLGCYGAFALGRPLGPTTPRVETSPLQVDASR